MDLDRLKDEELIARARETGGEQARACLGVLYERFYPRVAYWCLKFCGRRDQATDLAQEVFARVHSRLHTFRAESRFSTWLYQVTRSVAINRGVADGRRRASSLEQDGVAEPVDPAPAALDHLTRRERMKLFREAMLRELEPLESEILYRHFVHGATIAELTRRLGLTNKSGAKAYIVSAKRKLRRRYGTTFEVAPPNRAEEADA